mmetsp:Transcript_15900/g.47243  ORF Transcript_15900/g.47243 Transcript_15900/m.47243 type:complete len:140 (-) Transcript_15900:142-561(-)
MVLRSAARALCTRAAAGKKALITGFTAPPGGQGPGGLTKEKLLAILAQQNEELARNGVSPTTVLFERTLSNDEIAAKVAEALTSIEYDVVSIGAGVRTFPEHMLLFEKLVNVVHKHAPAARIAFDTGPGDKVESILRNL